MPKPSSSRDQFNRNPSRLLAKIEGGDAVIVEKHGQPTAAMIPMPRPTSGPELARRLELFKPDPETAAELDAILKQVNEAE
jgi:antitoxin (DNA-binding transcriptional repressor) of toxin-antitoxin stability system